MSRSVFNTEQIKSREDFRQFLNWLVDDYKHNSASWENDSLDGFLKALQAYSRDIDGYYKWKEPTLDPEQPSWRQFADLLDFPPIDGQ